MKLLTPLHKMTATEATSAPAKLRYPVKRLVTVLIAFTLLASAGMARSALRYDINGQPDTAFASNVAIDIIKHQGGVWLATGNGLNYSFDNGRTWLLYDSTNGLKSNDISAMFSVGESLWVATNHVETVSGYPLSMSDGIQISGNGGATWKQIRFDSLSPVVPYVFGGYRTIYDITGFDDHRQNRNWLFFTAFAGGLLASQDGGASWRRIFSTRADSANFDSAYDGTAVLSLQNRYFSCVVDTSHGDSMFLWVGTAGGISQLVYVMPSDKFYVRQPRTAVFCSDSTFMYIGGGNGLSRGSKTGKHFTSQFTSDGLPGNTVSALTWYGKRLLVAAFDSATGGSTGLAYSTDHGDNFTTATFNPAINGTLKKIQEFALIRNRLYLAAERAGLYASSDSGNTWTRIYVDSTDSSASNKWNVVNSVASLGDTLWVGTDTGVVILRLGPTGTVNASIFHGFPENEQYSSRVIRIKVQRYNYNHITDHYDSLAVWTVNHPDTTLASYGSAMVGRHSSNAATDTTWEPYQVGVVSNGIGIMGDTTLILQKRGIKLTADGLDPFDRYMVVLDSLDNSIIVSSYEPTANDDVSSLQVAGDTVVITSKIGVSVSTNRGKSFKVIRPVLDSLATDIAIRYQYLTSFNEDTSGTTVGMTGSFVPALGIRYPESGTAQIIASCRPDTIGSDGVCVGRVVEVKDSTDVLIGYKYRWDPIYQDGFAWNVDVLGDTAIISSDQGLLFARGISSPQTATVDTFSFRDSSGNVILDPGTAVYAARVVDSFLWVGSDDGAVRIRLNDMGDQKLFRVVDQTPEVYAFPVPFSPNRGDQKIDFHFVLDQDAYVTVEVYDFAMNLVSRPIDNVFYSAGAYPGTGSQGRTWNGRNGKGDVVAVGMYYFKVKYSTGEVQWGKLAVIP